MAENRNAEQVATRMITYPFIVRRDVIAELRLPVDLTLDEAKRLAQCIEALALDG